MTQLLFHSKSYYVNISFKDEKPKGLRPVASVSSLTSEEEQHVMVCIKILKYKDVRYDQQLFYLVTWLYLQKVEHKAIYQTRSKLFIIRYSLHKVLSLSHSIFTVKPQTGFPFTCDRQKCISSFSVNRK